MLQALYNNNANKIAEQAMKEESAIHNLNFIIDLAMVTNEIKPLPEEPKTFNEAWAYPNATSSAKWWEAIHKEFANMNEQ